LRMNLTMNLTLSAHATTLLNFAQDHLHNYWVDWRQIFASSFF
jgi:hypothetical protein